MTWRFKLFRNSYGNYFLPSNAPNEVINDMKRGIFFDANIIKVAEKYIRPGTNVLDVGANFGQMSILFSKLVGSDGKVYSFDADDYVFEVFKKNISANKCANIEPVLAQYIISTIRFFISPNRILSNLLPMVLMALN